MSTLRGRLFVALASSVLLGALVTGLYAVALDVRTIGFAARLASVAPKAIVLAVGLLAVAAVSATILGRRLARPAEQLADAAGRSWHDLKTPLAAIRATIEVLEDGALQDPVAARRFVGNLARASADLDRMLGDLVTLARMEKSGGEHSVSVGTVVAGAVERVAPLAAAKGVALTAPDRELLSSQSRLRDAEGVAQALANLLENAVDASPGGSVRVSVDDGLRSAVFVDVFNEPAAVPGVARAHLFERPAARAGIRGSGLSIARAAIEAQGGHVRFVELGPPRVHVRVELPR